MAALSTYPQATTLADTDRVPIITNPGVAGGNGWINALDLRSVMHRSSLSAKALLPANAMAESMPRSAGVNTSIALVSGRLHLVALPLVAGQVITSLSFVSGATALVTGTIQWVALYSSALALLRQSADQVAAAWAANTLRTVNLATTYTVPTSGLYYAGIMVTAATAPSLIGGAAMSAPVSTIPPILNGFSTTGCTAVAPATAAALTAGVSVPYCYAL